MADWIYGRRAVCEILKTDQFVKKIVLAEVSETPEIREIISAAQSKGIPIENVSRHALNGMVHGNHQGAAAQIGSIAPVEFKTFLDNLTVTKQTFVCLLDEVQDPQNLGAIIRNAVCLGCSGIILPKWRSASVTPAVMKASSGALAHCSVAQISNLGVAVERLIEKGFFVYGADADPSAVPLETAEISFPAALILGSEHAGIKPVLKKSCDALLRISQESKVQSLNVASASAIFFHTIASRVR